MDIYALPAICKSQNGELVNGMRVMMGTQEIRARTWRTGVGTRGIKVRMLGISMWMRGIKVGMRGMGVEILRMWGIRVGMQVYKYLADILQGFC